MEYKKGDYITKKNATLFKYKMYDEKYYSAFDVVRNVEVGTDNKIFINGRTHFPETLPTIVSKEEAYRLQEIWEGFANMEVSPSSHQEFEHFREDNGEAKINSVDYPEVLYMYALKYPDRKYNVYRCSVCDKIHIGKVREVEVTV